MDFDWTYGRQIPAMKVRSRLRGGIISGRGSPQSVFFARYDPKGGDRAKKPKRAKAPDAILPRRRRSQRNSNYYSCCLKTKKLFVPVQTALALSRLSDNHARRFAYGILQIALIEFQRQCKQIVGIVEELFPINFRTD